MLRYGVPALVIILVIAAGMYISNNRTVEAPAEVDVAAENAAAATSTDENMEEDAGTQIAARSLRPNAPANTKGAVPLPTPAPAPAPEVQSTVQVITANLKRDEAMYAKALVDYENWRLQIENCSALPGSFTMKSGNYFLLDGTSPNAQQLSFNGTAVNLGGDDARVLRLVSPDVATVSVDCSSGATQRHNIATITVMP